MKTENIIWGIVFVFIGAILLLDNFHVIDFYWRSVWQLWPLILIISGANMIFAGSRSQLGSIAAIVITVGALATIAYFGINKKYERRAWWSGRGETDTAKNWTTSNTFTEAFEPGTSKATLNISGGATVYTLSDTTTNLFDADVEQNYGHYSLQKISSDSVQVLNFRMNNKDKRWDMGDTDGNEARLRLNTRPVWDINVETGAGKTEFDLTPFKVNRLELKGGAASFEVKLGEPVTTTHVTAETGVAEINISVPSSVGCKIRVDSGLSSKNFDGFNQQPDGSYTTPNYANSAKKIDIYFKGGLSDFKVNRY
ncbi:LiaI-LiaF-like domain-containing protein [Rubrolithibacter danxiaensis]|uniref:LiaI-LiaF-like domain-containing protein n=1 Tax=Rubrolithibacter danxiaensis TaxID=3390805 RepID=UPI003BF78542